MVHNQDELKNFIKQKEYDILLMDKELEETTHNILKTQHSKMNVIMLAQQKSTTEYFNTKLIKEIHAGILKRDRLEQLIKKYRR